MPSRETEAGRRAMLKFSRPVTAHLRPASSRLFSVARDWFVGRAPEPSCSPPVASQLRGETLERTFAFGDGAAMVAVTTEPSDRALLDPARPAVLILNAGIIHRIGPSRNSVDLARHLAREGFFVMRFDLSGIGDSESRKDNLTMEEHAVLDVRQAMAHLRETRGFERFVLVGLCSGADNALRVARHDAAVVGAVLLDGYGYKTPGYFVRYYARRALHWENYPSAARRLASRTFRRAQKGLRDRFGLPETEPSSLVVTPQWERVFPSREAFAADLQALVDRSVTLLFIYTAGVERYYNYAEQLAESVPEVDFRGLVDTEYFADSDHTITEQHSKAQLVTRTVAWFRRHFPSGERGGPVSPSSRAAQG